MKKIFAILLTVAMLATMSVTAFAAVTDGGTGDYEIDISANYQPGAASDEVISVDIAWGEMEFTYHGAAEGQWNPSTHDWDGGAEARWEATGNTISVTNHSNAAIKATFAYNAAVTTVTGSFSHNTLELPTAVGTTKDAAPSSVTTLTLGGTLAESGKVGTVTVTIAKNQ